MDDFTEKVYLLELIQQCHYAQHAVQRMNEFLKNGNPVEFFREAGHFLQHSSTVSRILWPSGSKSQQKKKRAEERGLYLKSTLAVADGHILQSRSLRDHLEHFDERLDEWAETSAHKKLADNLIGPRSALGSAVKDGEIMRMYDPTKKEVVFMGKKFEMQTLVNGVEDVKAKAAARLQDVEANKRLQPTDHADGALGG
jgi:hypothetical protein